MFVFTSPHRRLGICDRKNDLNVNFIPIGAIGTFQTEDEELAEKLRNHKEYGKRFVENALPKKRDSNIIQGIRSGATQPVLSDEKLIRFGELKATLLKNDGSYRKDATPELIQEYEKLLGELKSNPVG